MVDRVIQFESFEVSQNEGEPNWSLSAVITYPADLITFTPYTILELDVYGEKFLFYVTRIALSKRSAVEVTSEISGVSISAKYDSRRSPTITKVWTTDTQASAIVSEVLVGATISWDMVDWLIPRDRLAVEAASPMEVALQVIEAAGGVLEALPNGDLYARPKFPIKATDYPNVEPDMEFDEGVDIYQVEDVVDLSDYINWIRVRSSDEAAVSDTVEFEFDEGTELIGTLFVYPSPWREVSMEHTGPDNVSLTRIGVKERTVEEELIAIEEGEATLKYPALEILDVVWQAVNLQSLYHEPYSRAVKSSHQELKYSLAKVTYTTKSIEYRTSSPVTQEVQFLVIDESEE